MAAAVVALKWRFNSDKVRVLAMDRRNVKKITQCLVIILLVIVNVTAVKGNTLADSWIYFAREAKTILRLCPNNVNIEHNGFLCRNNHIEFNAFRLWLFVHLARVFGVHFRLVRWTFGHLA